MLRCRRSYSHHFAQLRLKNSPGWAFSSLVSVCAHEGVRFAVVTFLGYEATVRVRTVDVPVGRNPPLTGLSDFRVHFAVPISPANTVGSAVDLGRLASNSFADMIRTTSHRRSPP
jgi:hypothetical protein